MNTLKKTDPRGPTSATFNTKITTIVANTSLSTAMGGTQTHDRSKGTYFRNLRCHDSNGELFIASLCCYRIRLSSLEADTIKTSPGSRADAIPALS